ncbi:hypothetical protein ACLM5J_01405 [Nocardioides sp. Bht2]|uniref:divisome protein SepX/GlpR n=1 Tax=Nocardioides sp. Bht2 TaxID=3392297 RepID=UPI0039B62477
MELSGIIFVAVFVAWAIYLVPMMRHRDEADPARSVERFSGRLRVLARRDTVDGKDTRLTVPGAAPSAVDEQAPTVTKAQLRARREATRKATERRRRVLTTLVTLNVLVAAVALAGVVGWLWQLVPAGLVVVWLVLCRVMVKSERATTQAMLAPRVETVADDAEADDVPQEYDVARNDQGFDEVAPESETTTIPAITEEVWDPMPVTLPTYVGKEKATRRTVRTIDLGSPGAWTSGHTAEDSELAREADEVAAATRDDEGEQQRAVGS